MYDVLLKGGTVIDPSQGIHGLYDVAVRAGRIAVVAPDIPQEPRSGSGRVLDVTGRLVTPGLIDIHAHVYEGLLPQWLSPDLAGVMAGVTTVVDAGSAGALTFGGMARSVIPRARTEVLCFLNVARMGLLVLPEVRSKMDIALEPTLRAVEEHGPLVHGIKVRAVNPGLRLMGADMVRQSKDIARQAKRPLMVHIGDTTKEEGPVVIREILSMLEPGDLVTHVFTPNRGGLLDDAGKLVPEAREAIERGVWMDSAHGRFNFSFDVAKRVMEQGFIPHSISSDLTTPGREKVVHSLAETMTRFLALGFSLEDVVRMTTLNPARALGLEERIGSLAPGRQADVTVLELRQGRWRVFDSLHTSLDVSRAVVPVLTMKRGDLFTPEWGPRPWGWLPDPAD